MNYLNKTRSMLIEGYVKSLKEDVIPWRCDWKRGVFSPRNAVSNRRYQGVNFLLLSMVSQLRGYDDPRWMTHRQIEKKGYTLNNALGKGVPIEYWSIHDKLTNKNISFEERDLIAAEIGNEEASKRFKSVTRYTHVFNAKHIVGLPELDAGMKDVTTRCDYIDKLISSLRVEYEESGDRAYYSPSKDKVTIPLRKLFDSDAGYHSTRLHELCHATGHETRLNRFPMDKPNMFDINERAKEELVAEISSSFISSEIGLEDAEHMDNHKAYIQNWISILENEPQELFNAISLSGQVADYCHDKVNELEMAERKERKIKRSHSRGM